MLWWLAYGVAPIPLAIAQGADRFGGNFGGDMDSLAESVDDRLALSFVSSFVMALAAVLYIVMVRQLSSRHRQLTGESASPT